MTIEEITKRSDICRLLSIAETYPKTEEEKADTEKQLSEELTEAGNNRHLFIAFEQGTAVAMIQIVLKNADNDPELADGDKIAHLHNLQVRSELQGRGIGQKMIRFIEEEGRKLGKKTVPLGVDDVNEQAIGLYDKLGYKLFKTVPGRIPPELGFCMKKQI